MPQKNPTSMKHEQIEKTNTAMFIIIAVAASLISFTIVSSIYLIKRLSYQSRVIDKRSSAEKQLKTNKAELDKLVTAYKSFDASAESVIGTNDKNSKIVLDALPSKYDFPALATSIEKLINLSGGISSRNITGSDLEATALQSSVNPEPVEIPLSISGFASYENVQKLITNLQLSIRPLKITKVSLSGEQSNMNFTINLITYYMPAKDFDIQLEEIK